VTLGPVVCTLACVPLVLGACSASAHRVNGRPDLLPLTAAETRAVGCYQLLAPVRRIAERFSLLAQYGRGAGPERFGRLVRPRGDYNSAYWSLAKGDTLELVWTSSPSDSTGQPGSVIFMDALRARVTQVGDTLRGRAVWGSDILDGPGTPTVFDLRAARIACTDTPSRQPPNGR
jgi:hypothetical protein